MRKSVLILLLFLLVSSPVWAVVEIALDGQPPVSIDEVYLRDGASFIALADLLEPLGLSGSWDAVEHVYRISTDRGTAVISPGSQFLKYRGRFIPVKVKPRFIDGQLRVSTEFVSRHMSDLVGERVYFRDLNPPRATAQKSGSALDRFFSFLLRKKKPADSPILRAVAIDPGHGGPDPGAIGIGGLKEKAVTLAVAQSLEKLIKMQLGIPIYLSRDNDYAVSAEDRLKTASQPDVDALLLLHAQSAAHYKPQGVHIYVRPAEVVDGVAASNSANDSMKLAKLIASSLREAGFNVYPIAEEPLLPLGRGDLPTVLIELGYLSNQADRLLLEEEEGQLRIARALFGGLKSFGERRKKEK